MTYKAMESDSGQTDSDKLRNFGRDVDQVRQALCDAAKQRTPKDVITTFLHGLPVGDGQSLNNVVMNPHSMNTLIKLIESAAVSAPSNTCKFPN